MPQVPLDRWAGSVCDVTQSGKRESPENYNIVSGSFTATGYPDRVLEIRDGTVLFLSVNRAQPVAHVVICQNIQRKLFTFGKYKLFSWF